MRCACHLFKLNHEMFCQLQEEAMEPLWVPGLGLEGLTGYS